MNSSNQLIKPTSVISTALLTMRLPFLTLTLVCVLLGLATAIYSEVVINWLYFSLCLIGAASAHIGVNTLNEYQDFKSGLDFNTVKTPFSGGSGGLVNSPEHAQSIKVIAYISLIITTLIGCYFIAVYGVQLFIIGLLGMIIIISYTKYLNKNAWLCLIAPGIAFGILMVVGTHYILTGNVSALVLITGSICAFLISNLLLFNQFPDIQADKAVGRKHFAIMYGLHNSLRMYLLFLCLSVITLGVACYFNRLPNLCYFAILPMLLGVGSYRKMKILIGDDKDTLPKDSEPLIHNVLALNVIAANITPLFLAVCLFITSYQS